MRIRKYTRGETESLCAKYATSTKIRVDPSWTKFLMETHPVQFITTFGNVRGKMVTDCAPFAACLDTSYNPPYITFASAVHQHSLAGQQHKNCFQNTYLNIKQNGQFIINIPPFSLANRLDALSYPYDRRHLLDKITKAELTKVMPYVLAENGACPPILAECLAHLECQVVDVHRVSGADHYLITGRVVGASYDSVLGRDLDNVRVNLVRHTFHHFGTSDSQRQVRYLAAHVVQPIEISNVFHAETCGDEKL